MVQRKILYESKCSQTTGQNLKQLKMTTIPPQVLTI